MSIVLLLGLFITTFANNNFKYTRMKTAQLRDKVKVHYTGTLTDGEVFDSSMDGKPIEFILGEGQLIPGFENAVKGMALNEEKSVTIPVDEAYGEMDESLIYEVQKSMLPQEEEPFLGMQLITQAPDGIQVPLIVTEIKEDTAVVDANHPLAGKELNFEIKLIEIVE